MEEVIEGETNKKTDPKERASDSLILGIISIVLFLIMTNNFQPTFPPNPLWNLVNYLPLDLQAIIRCLSFLSPVAAIVGLILAIKGLKSTRKKVAIAGLILCTISLLLFLFSILYIFIIFYGTTQ